MLKIVPYENAHQNGIDIMMNEIASEFDTQIVAKPSNETPIVPNNYWVAVHNEKVIGTVGVMVIKNGVGILKKMMLKKSFRGKELGISKLLLETVIHWCEQNDISKIYLGTMDQFKVAQLFYEKNGFKRISKSALPKEFLKNPLDTVFFEYDLNELNHSQDCSTLKY